jgi:site-specific DNA-methyltransferase (adenine-specific)
MKLLRGDCLELMKKIPDKSVDMILCDLPYGTTACKWDVVIPFEPLWVEYKRIIKHKGAVILTASQPFTTKLISSNINNFKYCWVWDKKIPSNFALAKRQPLKYHEDVCVFSFEPHNYYPIFRENVKKPFGKIVAGNSEHIKIAAKQERGFGYPKSILEFAKPNNLSKDGNLHSTQKPVALLEYLIKTYTLEGETVLDNCMGSGSTGVACVHTGRNFIGIEKEKKYFDIACKRIKEARTGLNEIHKLHKRGLI